MIEEAKKKTEVQERPLFVGYYNDGNLDLETMNQQAIIQKLEESKRTEGPYERKKNSKTAPQRSGEDAEPAEEVKLQKKGRKKKRKNFKQH